MIYFEAGGPQLELSQEDLKQGIQQALENLGERRKVLAIPPDITRYYSQAGLLTQFAYDFYGERLTDILPALGTHAPMTPPEIERMFGDLPQSLFRVHDWRNDVVSLGEVPGSYIDTVSEGRISYPWDFIVI